MVKVTKITFVGDVFLSNTWYTQKFGIGQQLLEKPDRLSFLKSTFANSDLVFGNLESPLINNPFIVRDKSFAGSICIAPKLKDIGFDIFSIANNHILEQGYKGFVSTQKALMDAGLYYVGVFNDYKSNIKVISKNGLKFGFCAFNSIIDIPNPNIHANLNLDSVKKTIDEMDELNVDYKLISFHWGNEFINIPSFEQIEFAHSVIDYGADIIIGHHPHVIQPIEKYKKGIIIYSLGNFIFDFQFSSKFKTGLMVTMEFSKSQKIDYSITCVKLGEKSYNNTFKSKKLEQYIQESKVKMINLYDKGSSKYNAYYSKVLIRNRLLQKLMMKVKVGKLILISKNRYYVLVALYNQLKKLFLFF